MPSPDGVLVLRAPGHELPQAVSPVGLFGTVTIRSSGVSLVTGRRGHRAIKALVGSIEQWTPSSARRVGARNADSA
jgi:hypothetical protein